MQYRLFCFGGVVVEHEKEFWRKLAPLALPMAFQQLMQSLVSASDALMMGLIDQSSLSAVSLATQIAFVVSLFIFETCIVDGFIFFAYIVAPPPAQWRGL